MKKKTFGFVATAILGVNMLLPVFAHAESLNELEKKETAITRQSDKISGELQLALNDVNVCLAKQRPRSKCRFIFLIS
ncbi:MAG: hypothetical protein ACTJFI_04095 [Enterococcus viikkiensis]